MDALPLDDVDFVGVYYRVVLILGMSSLEDLLSSECAIHPRCFLLESYVFGQIVIFALIIEAPVVFVPLFVTSARLAALYHVLSYLRLT